MIICFHIQRFMMPPLVTGYSAFISGHALNNKHTWHICWDLLRFLEVAKAEVCHPTYKHFSYKQQINIITTRGRM